MRTRLPPIGGSGDCRATFGKCLAICLLSLVAPRSSLEAQRSALPPESGEARLSVASTGLWKSVHLFNAPSIESEFALAVIRDGAHRSILQVEAWGLSAVGRRTELLRTDRYSTGLRGLVRLGSDTRNTYLDIAARVAFPGQSEASWGYETALGAAHEFVAPTLGVQGIVVRVEATKAEGPFDAFSARAGINAVLPIPTATFLGNFDAELGALALFSTLNETTGPTSGWGVDVHGRFRYPQFLREYLLGRPSVVPTLGMAYLYRTGEVGSSMVAAELGLVVGFH